MQMSLFDTPIARVSKVEAKAFYDQHHYIGGCGNSWTNFARYDNGVISACVSFGQPASPNIQSSWFSGEQSNHVFELTRLAIAGSVPASSFVATAIEALVDRRQRNQDKPIYALISYADSSVGHHGGVYQAMSWHYCGLTKGTSGYLDAEGKMVHRRSNSRNIDSEEAEALGLIKTTTGVKHRYVKLIGTKKQRRKMMRALNYEILPYPKPEEG